MSDLMTYLPSIAESLLITLGLMAFALVLSLFFSFFLTWGRLSKNKLALYPSQGVVFFIRGTPLLVQIFLIYYGFAQLEWLRGSLLWFLFQKPFFCAVFALALNSASYSTELFCGAIRSIPQGEVEACSALGLRGAKKMWYVVLPRAFRLVLPAYSNEVVIVLKSTSLASTITILELTGMTQELISQTYNPMFFFLIAGAIYLILNTIILRAFAWLSGKVSSD